MTDAASPKDEKDRDVMARYAASRGITLDETHAHFPGEFSGGGGGGDKSAKAEAATKAANEAQKASNAAPGDHALKLKAVGAHMEAAEAHRAAGEKHGHAVDMHMRQASMGPDYDSARSLARYVASRGIK